MRVIGHIFSTLFHAIVRIFLTALFCGLIGFGVTLLIVFVKSNHWPPDTLTMVGAIAVGVLALYAGGITVLMSESIHALQEAAKDVEGDSANALKGAAQIAQEIEKRL